MKQFFLLPLVLAAACTKGHIDMPFESDVDLSQVPTSVNPPGGTFSYRPAVTIIKETTAKETGILKVMAPGEYRYTHRSVGLTPDPGCSGVDLDKPEEDRRASTCLEIRQTGDLRYYLGPSWFVRQDDGDKRTEHYDINLVTHEVDVDGKVTPEVDTLCGVKQNDDGSVDLNLVIEFEEFRLNVTREILEPKAVKDAPNEVTPWHRPQRDDLGREVGGCIVTSERWETGGESYGTFSCTDFEGPYRNLSGRWTCDGYN